MKANLLGILKLILFVFLLPFISALLLSFYVQVVAIGEPNASWLYYGALVFVAIYLFVYNFKEVYEFGQNVVIRILAFVKPIVNVASLVIPVYPIIFSVVFLILNSMGILGKFESIALMSVSFTWMMHVVLTAKQLNEGEKAVVKGGYFFGFGLALIFHVLIAALLLAMMLHEFSLVNFVKNLSHQTVHIYHSIYMMLFVPRS